MHCFSVSKRTGTFSYQFPVAFTTILQMRTFMVLSKIYLSAINNGYSISYLFLVHVHSIFFSFLHFHSVLYYVLLSICWSIPWYHFYSVRSSLFASGFSLVPEPLRELHWEPDLPQRSSAPVSKVQKRPDEIMIKWWNCVVMLICKYRHTE